MSNKMFHINRTRLGLLVLLDAIKTFGARSAEVADLGGYARHSDPIMKSGRGSAAIDKRAARKLRNVRARASKRGPFRLKSVRS